jgi:putative heme-binding domain-containing protein
VACSSCHTIGAQGGHVGPDLTAVGAIRSGHDLLEAIVFPSASFVPGHEIYRVETATDVWSGVLLSRSEQIVTLITGPNGEVHIPREQVRHMSRSPVSLMPEGFDEVLSAQEFADLLAYLRSQTSRETAAAL